MRNDSEHILNNNNDNDDENEKNRYRGDGIFINALVDFEYKIKNRTSKKEEWWF